MASTPLPSKIAAIGISQTGDVDVIQNLDLPFPSPTPTQFVIKVEYAGVNFLDVQLRNGNFPVPALPTALGVEAAGTIVALPTDPALLNSEAFQKRGFKLGGKVACFGLAAGTFAEYTLAAPPAVLPLPPSVPPRVGAASLVQGLTALTFASEPRGLCKQRGAVVIGTTSTAEKAAVAREHGADHVILYRDEDVAARVLEITEGSGVHAIFDGVGKDTFETNLKAIRAKGTIVAMGSASGRIAAFDPKLLYPKNVKFVYPSATMYVQDPENGRDYGQELVDLLASGAVKPVVGKEYPFTAEGVAQSQKDLAEGRSVGKLLIKVASE
ncbi:hypothetical protein GSI_03547 [Ganoderma sinense ZZ0214-1]|uniref:Enoyl reductase (ER) domain-containing protein n=1 Tax=Ganoderma sinense ZZ0214-1 TaxID=1077348 RepID=A0A2G8SJB1_9APHY|nr:hypothetical protein GSI_03547 [Ganoderma sinense ZZ0214-1]